MRSRHAAIGAVITSLLLASSAVAQPRRSPPRRPPPPAPTEFISVTVRAGETCAAVARRVYRAPSRTDVIHQHNPTVCPPQRRLTAVLIAGDAAADERTRWVRSREDAEPPAVAGGGAVPGPP